VNDLTARKPISKRVRFDVFKRDGFVCQYCGAHPPGVVLECDHINPVAQGGGNDPDNLVTACLPCNRGKGAVGLDVVPQSLAARAAQVAEAEAQVAGYNAILEAKRERVENEAWRVVEALMGEARCSPDELRSVKTFVERLGVHEALDAADIAYPRSGTRDAKWRYFCGICWSKIRGTFA